MFGNWVNQVMLLTSAYWPLETRQEDVRESIGNLVNNIVMSIYGARFTRSIGGNTL